MDRELLQHVRDELLALHKVLLRFQQHEYEQSHQPVPTPAALFQLVTDHPAFGWLRTLSELIVGIDVFLESEKPESVQYESLIEYTKNLLVPDPSGNDFAQNYFGAIQKSPEIGVVHGKLMHLLSPV